MSLVLTFSRNSTTNCVIECGSAGVHYEVTTTPGWSLKKVTTVTRVSEKGRTVVGEWERNCFLTMKDRIRLGQDISGEFEPLGSIFPRTKAICINRAFRDKAGRQYTWKTRICGLRLERTDQEQKSGPIAVFNRARFIFKPRKATIDVHAPPSSPEVLDLLILSFLIVKHGMERRNHMIAAGVGGLAFL